MSRGDAACCLPTATHSKRRACFFCVSFFLPVRMRALSDKKPSSLNPFAPPVCAANTKALKQPNLLYVNITRHTLLGVHVAVIPTPHQKKTPHNRRCNEVDTTSHHCVMIMSVAFASRFGPCLAAGGRLCGASYPEGCSGNRALGGREARE
eukprot:359285-Chlamydomonas_euryale.AAC.9